ncbi:hypothetical protein E2C01_059667 [Portunus trituberculatus]|uniref:Uncharacterized protein n=1 Tax=Portunus trituberculatus TaxID=210409 RepID=A0A5B7GZY6_PORTR|nr:hypothetical protein [Portunus trituberculatus]
MSSSCDDAEAVAALLLAYQKSQHERICPYQMTTVPIILLLMLMPPLRNNFYQQAQRDLPPIHADTTTA